MDSQILIRTLTSAKFTSNCVFALGWPPLPPYNILFLTEEAGRAQFSLAKFTSNCVFALGWPPLPPCNILFLTEEVGRAQFSLAAPTYTSVAYSIYNSQTKLIKNYFERSTIILHIDHFRIVSIRPGWAHSQRRVGVNITIPLHWPSCEWTLTPQFS